MSELRLNFLNWRPDAEDFSNDGLTVATNLVHGSEGYKQIRLTTDSSVATTSPLTTSVLTDVRAARVGTNDNISNGNKIFAFVPSTTPSLSVATGFETITISFPTAAASSVALTAFQVTEINNNIFIVAQAEGLAAGGTAVSANFTGYVAV